MASLTITFDVLVMLIPFPVLIKAQIRRRRKIVLLALLGLGIFITVIQILRIRTVVRLANYLDSAPLIMWSTVENNLGVIVVCVPILAPLVKYFNEKVQSTDSSNPTSSRRYATGSRTYQTSRRHSHQVHCGSYALQSWGARTSDMTSVGQGADYDVVGNKDDTASTDCILEGSGGIVKRIEVTVTRDHDLEE